MTPLIPGVPVSPSILKAQALAREALAAERHTVEQAIRDGVITAKVKMRLNASPLTTAYGIHVETFQGHVRLSGFVDTTEIAAAALELAQDVEGVQLIEDLLDTRTIGPHHS